MSIPNSENTAPAAQDTAAHASMIEKVKNFVHSLGLASMGSRLHDHAAETPHEDMKYYFGPSAAGSTATLTETMTPSDTTGSTTPSSIRSTPERLQMRIPPPNYGAVVPGSIYRSSYPDPTNHEFLRDLKIKSILTLVPEPIAPAYQSFMDEAGIQHFQVHISANKGAVMVDSCAMSRALRLLMDRTNHPILVHCNKGKHRTGCTIACFRRITGLGMEAVRDEYHTYAGKKARLFDEVFFENFDLNLVMWMAREQGWVPTIAAPLSPPATPPKSGVKPVDAHVDIDALEAVDADARKATDAAPREAMDAVDALKILTIAA
jgi:tyrosine-protein phosphatase SIW14